MKKKHEPQPDQPREAIAVVEAVTTTLQEIAALVPQAHAVAASVVAVQLEGVLRELRTLALSLDTSAKIVEDDRLERAAHQEHLKELATRPAGK